MLGTREVSPSPPDLSIHHNFCLHCRPQDIGGSFSAGPSPCCTFGPHEFCIRGICQAGRPRPLIGLLIKWLIPQAQRLFPFFELNMEKVVMNAQPPDEGRRRGPGRGGHPVENPSLGKCEFMAAGETSALRNAVRHASRKAGRYTFAAASSPCPKHDTPYTPSGRPVPTQSNYGQDR